MKSVSIIIPNWNGADLLRAHLPSVVDAEKKYRGTIEVIVVDDASSDASLEILQEEFPGIKAVVHPNNLGFGRACWSGAQTAQHSILIFLNSDVAVAPDFVEPLVNNLEDPAAFAASPLIFDDQNNLSNATISIPYFRRGKIRYQRFPTRHLLHKGPPLPNPWYTLFPSGAAFAVDRARFLELQGFDDLFSPFYYEDTDLGFRAWRRGWKCIVAPESRVTHHHYSGTITRSFKQLKVRAIRKRNRLFFLWKNLTTARLLRQHLLFQLLRVCYRPFCLDWMILVATVLAIQGFNAAMQKRRAEQKFVVNSEEAIFQIIGSANQANRRAIESIEHPGRDLKPEP
ncbi:MAG: glycosyltransferase family 2 protein [Desulfobacteraceae bacterium]|jgi:GT2 family glycosyltransferase|nr:glycosyltransferase family 2 protein [Desulfobacteraceae bacterium]